MENAVRYVHVDDASFKPALCFRGESRAYAIVQDVDQIKTVTIKLIEFDKANPVMYHGLPYNTRAYADRLLMSAKAASRPLSRRSRQLLIGLDTIEETALVADELELEDVRVLSDRSPSERNKASRRPGPVLDRTDAYKAEQQSLRETEQAAAPPVPGEVAATVRKARKAAGKAPKVPPKPPAAEHRTATAVRKEKPAPVEAPPPPKGPKTATVELRSAVKPKLPYGGRGLVVQKLAHELSTDPKSLRVRLRAAGLKAPYDDIAKMRKALK